jgi:hypothetical protein
MDPRAAPSHDETDKETIGIASPPTTIERASVGRHSHHIMVALNSLSLSLLRGVVQNEWNWG